ncbi:MAG: peptide-methionine (R)-S-oxide reductase, partial [Planctomycetaceae bacterium]
MKRFPFGLLSLSLCGLCIFGCVDAPTSESSSADSESAPAESDDHADSNHGDHDHANHDHAVDEDPKIMAKDSYNQLTAEERKIIINKGTEYPGTGELYKNKETGTYVCRQCNAALYGSEH